jgi:regulator of sirC expression with transglutaminase-like and TPR domain
VARGAILALPSLVELSDNRRKRLGGSRSVLRPFAHSPEFERLAAGEQNVEIARVALEFACDAYPELDIQTYLERIRQLAARVRDRFGPGASARDIVGQINWVLFVEEKMRGDEESYGDPRNSYLNEVLDRGLGIPISLSTVYAAVARQAGVAMSGANLPYHFMLRIDEAGSTWFVDPFHGGAVYNLESCTRVISRLAGQPVVLADSAIEPCSPQVVVTRMLRNLKAIYVKTQDLASLLPVERRLAALNPNSPEELRDFAVLCLKAECHGEAIDPLEAYLQLTPTPDDADEIRELLAVVRRQVARWN